MPRAFLALIFLGGLATSLGSRCVDKNDSCGSWQSGGECTKNPGYMNKNCAKSCGKCGGTGGSSCVDKNARCGSWQSSGECTKNPGYMNKNCAKSCGKCGGTGGGSCTDKNTMCAGWANSGECTKNPDYMTKNCAKSCGCGGTGTTVTSRPVVIGNNKFGCNGGIKPYPGNLKNAYFYKKICYTAQGLKIISSNQVSDAALERTAFLISHVMQNVDPAVPRAMNRYKFRHAVMAAYPIEVTTNLPEYAHLGAFYNERARGLGATVHLPLGSSAVENAMCHYNDRYKGEDITIHEYAHSLHLTGFAKVFPGFERELQGLYSASRAAQLWGPYHYANTDYKEYFAEGVQSYFNSNMDDFRAPTTRDQLRQKDPNLYRFVDRYLGRNYWNWSC